MEPRREDFPEQHVCENEFSPDQQLLDQEENSGLEQVEPEPPQIKEEQEELCISQGGEQLVVKLEVDNFMVPLISEEKQQSEAEPNIEQLLSHNSVGIEIQDEGGGRHVNSGLSKEGEEPKPKKRRLRTGSHHEDKHSDGTCPPRCLLTEGSRASSALGYVGSAKAALPEAPQLHDCKEEKVLTVQQLCNQERSSTLDQEEQSLS
ncbi:uncharacterized protein KZ484_012094 [Pholidichthys leucotaenia]